MRNLTLACCVAAAVLASSAPAMGDAADDPRRQALAEQLPAWLQRSETPSAAVAFIEDGRVRWTLVGGEQAPGVPASPHTLYNVASLTKPITAETALRALDAGMMDVDDSMAGFWVDPDLRDDPRHAALTPRLCLSHQCGLPNWRDDDGMTLQSDPGSAPSYSGEGFDYVARYLQARLQASLPELASQHVFAPLGMTSTAFTGQPWFDGRVAVPRGPDGSHGEPDVRSQWSAADDLHTTVGDYATFVASVMQGQGLTPALATARWDTAHDVSAAICQPDRLQGDDCPGHMGFALGWVRFETATNTVFLHGGGDWGERAFAMFVPELQVGVVVFTNGAGGMAVIRDVIATLYPNRELVAFLAMQAGG